MFGSSLAYSLSLEMEVIYSSEKSFESHETAQCYIQEHRTLLSHHYESHMFHVENCHLFAFSGNLQETHMMYQGKSRSLLC
jgi:UDP-galactopyranose mutase